MKSVEVPTGRRPVPEQRPAAERPAAYWERIAAEWSATRPQQLWRSYSDALNEALVAPWLASGTWPRVLKTDAFDEAVGARGLYPALSTSAKHVVGIDLSRNTLRAARTHHAGLCVANADVRRLPFGSFAFDFVLSLSTLDHLESIDDIAAGLAEIRRVMRDGGRLLLTLDNGSNPIVALRNRLPQRALTSAGLIPYEMGATCGPARLRALVRDAGFERLELGALGHCPRAPAVAISNWLDRVASDRTRRAFVRSLLAWERLAAWPTRYWTGYYITVAGVAA